MVDLTNAFPLSQLVSLIAEATKVVEAEYAKSITPSLPSLNDIDPHPLDSVLPTAALRKAVQTIEGACAQLCATVARPTHVISNVRTIHLNVPIMLTP